MTPMNREGGWYGYRALITKMLREQWCSGSSTGKHEWCWFLSLSAWTPCPCSNTSGKPMELSNWENMQPILERTSRKEMIFLFQRESLTIVGLAQTIIDITGDSVGKIKGGRLFNEKRSEVRWDGCSGKKRWPLGTAMKKCRMKGMKGYSASVFWHEHWCVH